MDSWFVSAVCLAADRERDEGPDELKNEVESVDEQFETEVSDKVFGSEDA